MAIFTAIKNLIHEPGQKLWGPKKFKLGAKNFGEISYLISDSLVKKLHKWHFPHFLFLVQGVSSHPHPTTPRLVNGLLAHLKNNLFYRRGTLAGLLLWLREKTCNREVVGSNPGAVYLMGCSQSYCTEESEIMVIK